MTIRLQDGLLRGVIRNDVRNTVDGWLQPGTTAAPQPPVLLSLVGNLQAPSPERPCYSTHPPPLTHTQTDSAAGHVYTPGRSAYSVTACSAQHQKTNALLPGTDPTGSSACMPTTANCPPAPPTQHHQLSQNCSWIACWPFLTKKLLICTPCSHCPSPRSSPIRTAC